MSVPTHVSSTYRKAPKNAHHPYGDSWKSWVAEIVALEKELLLEVADPESKDSTSEIEKKNELIENCRSALSYLAQINKFLRQYLDLMTKEGGIKPDEQLPKQLTHRVGGALNISGQAVYKWFAWMGLEATSFSDAIRSNKRHEDCLVDIAYRSKRFVETIGKLWELVETRQKK
jgi:hypothetical protein